MLNRCEEVARDPCVELVRLGSEELHCVSVFSRRVATRPDSTRPFGPSAKWPFATVTKSSASPTAGPVSPGRPSAGYCCKASDLQGVIAQGGTLLGTARYNLD